MYFRLAGGVLGVLELEGNIEEETAENSLFVPVDIRGWYVSSSEAEEGVNSCLRISSRLTGP